MKRFNKNELKECLTINGSINTYRVKKLGLSTQEFYELETPKCAFCDNNAIFISFRYGFRNYCELHKKEGRIKKLNETNMEKYGFPFITQIPEIKKKQKETFKRNHLNCDSLTEYLIKAGKFYQEDGTIKSQSQESREKREATNLKKYGTKYPITLCEKVDLRSPEVNKKRAATNLKKYGHKNGIFATKEGQRKAKEGIKKKYSVNHPLHLEEIKDKWITSQEKATLKRLNDINEDGLNSFQIAARKSTPKRRITNIRKGRWLPENEYSDFKSYRLAVNKYTNRQEIKDLEHYEKRGRGKYYYQLDHKFSVFEGYKNGILPEAIGHIENLEFIPQLENRLKSAKCSISLKEIKNIENNIKERNE